MGDFHGRTVSFREGNCQIQHIHHLSDTPFVHEYHLETDVFHLVEKRKVGSLGDLTMNFIGLGRLYY